MKTIWTYSLSFICLLLFLNSTNKPLKIDDYSKKLYSQIDNLSLDYDIFHKSLTGYFHLLKNGKLKNSRYLSIVDMSLSANKERYFLIDVKEKKLIAKTLIAHGKNTGSEFAKYFSNTVNSYQTSLGFYTTAETYDGGNGLSMRMDGLEYSNSKARVRDIVVHKADYVSYDFIKEHGRLGRSFGCPALPISGYEKIISKIKNGSCFFIYYPDNKYLLQSKILKKGKELMITEEGFPSETSF
jgi:hypothetical protein